jgi:hypothetical protein
MTDGRHVKSIERREVLRSEIVIRDRLIDDIKRPLRHVVRCAKRDIAAHHATPSSIAGSKP